MKKLLAAYKELPTEMRLLLAMAGLGAPTGIVFFLGRQFGVDYLTVVFGLIVLVVVIALVSFVVSKLFGRAAARRNRRMEAELARGSESGPVSMDLGAAIKANNEKFFSAIRDMRKNLRVSIYDLPWYIVIGDSGCGKTKLVNEGGLTFSSGKPEGYQLGTLNYNWWFTEDAVFVDMAGRLCNPQDDGDRREWLAFLDTIAKGRKGFPINGALVCISAEHLMQDPPEKHEQDANTALERLRDLQSRLGVTFATHLVVTKCDKILGFMQFFDRAERDITFKNQIFGWSRPGSFDEPYDPDVFARDFDGLYARLNELRLRRLNDDSDEVELGLAYSFPEEYRQLREPLETYVRTLFPMIRNPRAVKNLLFRGVYFTSATQQGEVILRHLTERLGAEAASSFAPLESLYPQPRPHFVKDLLFKKVFPEYGLVFRNEQQVIRNRRLSRMLKVGSAAMAVVLFGALGLSLYQFRETIGSASAMFRADADATPVLPDAVASPASAMAACQEVSRAVEQLENKQLWANILSLGIGAKRPLDNLEAIRMNLFHKRVLPAVLREVDQRLAGGEPHRFNDDPGRPVPNAYMDALAAYVHWYGDRPPSDTAEWIASFRRLCSVVDESRVDGAMLWGREARAGEPASPGEAEAYFNNIQRWKLNPAEWMHKAGFEPARTIQLAVAGVHDYLAPYARLDTHADAILGEWMRIRDRCAEVERSYNELLRLRADGVRTIEDFRRYQAAFVQEYKPEREDGRVVGFVPALDDCRWTLAPDPPPYVRIDDMLPKIESLRRLWTGYVGELQQAFSRSNGDGEMVGTIASLADGGGPGRLTGLDPLLWESLKERELINPDYRQMPYRREYLERSDELRKLVQEVPARYQHVIELRREANASHEVRLTEDARTVAGALKTVHEHLSLARIHPSDDPGEQVPAQWNDRLFEVLDRSADGAVAAVGVGAAWRPDGLDALQADTRTLISRGEATQLLSAMAARLQPEQGRQGWGLAELYPDWDAPQPSAYQIPFPERVVVEPPTPDEPSGIRLPADAVRRPVAPAPPPGEPPAVEPDATRRRPRTAEDDLTPQVARPAERRREHVIPEAATQAFLNDRAWDVVQLLIYLQQIRPGDFLAGEGEAGRLNELCLERLRRASRSYADAYVKAWRTGYQNKRFSRLEALNERASWQELAGALREGGPEVAHEIQAGLADVFEALAWATFHSRFGWWKKEEGHPDRREWGEMEGWFREALRTHFAGDAPSFVGADWTPPGTPPGTAGLRPWDELADDFVRAWREVSNAIVNTSNLPRSFEQPEVGTLPAMSWGRIAQLRRERRLEGDKLTGALTAFEAHAQLLLSTELTAILGEIQRKHLEIEPRRETDIGWPYLAPRAAGDTLATVDFARFRSFLRELTRAKQAFEQLEKDLPDDEQKKARQQLYASCQAWLDFLNLDRYDAPAPLGIVITSEDPVGRGQPIDDTAQQYYMAIEVGLGLTRTGEQADHRPGQTLSIPTTLRESAQTQWNWSRGAERPLTIRLVDGIQGEGKSEPYPTITMKDLGAASELAFCAYLQRYASPQTDRHGWVALHATDLREAFADKPFLIPRDKTRIGVKFVFRLDRPLPEPIARLDPARFRAVAGR